MFKNSIYLYILKFNKSTLRYELLSINNAKIVLPNYIIESGDQSTEDIVYSILKKYLLIDPKFINYKLSDIEINNDELNIYYYALIPFNTPCYNSYFIELYNEIYYPKNLSKIIRLL